MNDDELYHYGVKGMKWKNHRYVKYENKVQKRQIKLDAIKNRHGVTSHEYREAAKQLNVLKSKRDLVDAKLGKDKNKILEAKEKVRTAKFIRDNGAHKITDKQMKDIFGKLDNKEVNSIRRKEKVDAGLRFVQEVIYYATQDD